MTPTDSNDGNSNDRMPAQEKLAWVTPKITPMEAIQTDGKPLQNYNEFYGKFGPS